MILKRLVSLAGLLAAMGLSAQSVMASPSFVNILNTNLGNGATTSCNACHVGGVGSGSTATLPMATTYKSARAAANYALVASSDSDGDGFTNAQEVNAATVNFNDKAITPFTLLAGQAFTGANVKAVADAAAAETAFTDTTGLAGTGQVILGGVKVTLNQADTIYFKAGGVDTTSLIYTVDATGAGTAVAAADWAVNANGSLIIKALPAGATTADYVVVDNAIDTTPAFTKKASVTGCLAETLTTPLLLLLSMLSLGMLLRRKQ